MENEKKEKIMGAIVEGTRYDPEYYSADSEIDDLDNQEPGILLDAKKETSRGKYLLAIGILVFLLLVIEKNKAS